MVFWGSTSSGTLRSRSARAKGSLNWPRNDNPSPNAIRSRVEFIGSNGNPITPLPPTLPPLSPGPVSAYVSVRCSSRAKFPTHQFLVGWVGRQPVIHQPAKRSLALIHRRGINTEVHCCFPFGGLRFDNPPCACCIYVG